MALIAAVIAVIAVVTVAPARYRLVLVFSDASGLVSGDEVLVGPAQVGLVDSIGLTPDGQAAVTVSLDPVLPLPLHEGTVARIEDSGLASIAGHYITLQPGPARAPALASGATIPSVDTHAEVSFDAVFDSFGAPTRAALARIIGGEATAIRGRSAAANATLHYLDPALGSTAALTAELTRQEGAFDGLLVHGATALGALAARAGQLETLVSATATATGAIAARAGALQRTLTVLPLTLTRSRRTLASTIVTLNTLAPVVSVATGAVRRLPAFSAALDTLLRVAEPTVTRLARVLPAAAGLLSATPGLARASRVAFPADIRAMNVSQTQLDTLLAYTPDIVSALSDLGQAGAYYDANGHYVRTQPFFNAFSLTAANQLTLRSPADRYAGLTHVSARCPGSAVQPSPDGSTPYAVPGCNPAQTP
ncbi:MlaD family protein [Conexibacter sp. DBS9H8]|uniref:MlaD family protein n=1 Tax=Conexibacter sp. DBS9H8 TaxID=2937801 RepID=UPI00201007AC|nr:MlaD family protein [Conexibacter sp. DBS9H8]